MDRFDLKQIPEFDGYSTGPSVVEWFEKTEHICKLFRIKEPMLIIPLRLTIGTYADYQRTRKLDRLNKCFAGGKSSCSLHFPLIS